MTKLAFIGGGKMAEAFIAPLSSPGQILVADIDKKRLAFLRQKYRVRVTTNNTEAFDWGEIVVLAVKPHHLDETLLKLESRHLAGEKNKIVVSIAAGVSLAYLARLFPGFPVVRAMPNNPCLVGQGMITLSQGNNVPLALLNKVKQIFSLTGEVMDVPERQKAAITGLSGSGPAFVYQVIAALIAGGVQAGLTRSVATKLALQTVLGAVATVKHSGKSPAELTKMVASPGGTTVEGLKVLEQAKVKQAIAKAVVAAARKAKKLAK